MDNVQWVRDHPEVQGVGIDQAFSVILVTHPYYGCAFDPLQPTPVVGRTINELEKYADAVTVACLEELGTQVLKINSEQTKKINLTAIANLAYIVKNHPDPLIREHGSRVFQTLMTQKFEFLRS